MPDNHVHNIDLSEYLPMVRRMAWSLAHRVPAYVSVDDLNSEGLMGLVEALQRYDDKRGASFSTFAYLRVKGRPSPRRTPDMRDPGIGGPHRRQQRGGWGRSGCSPQRQGRLFGGQGGLRQTGLIQRHYHDQRRSGRSNSMPIPRTRNKLSLTISLR